MKISSTGWFLHVAPPDMVGQPGELVRQDFELDDLAGDEVLAEPLYGCWEGNMDHALSRRPIDICRMRGEERVVIGNAGVVRIAAVGNDVRNLQPEQHAVVFASSVIDRFGYPKLMLAYDAPGTMGCLATRIKLKARELEFVQAARALGAEEALVLKDLSTLLGHDIRVHGDPLLHQEQFDVVPQ